MDGDRVGGCDLRRDHREAGGAIEHFPAKACPGLDPGWMPVRLRKCDQTKNLQRAESGVPALDQNCSAATGPGSACARARWCTGFCARVRLRAVLMSATWVKACGKLPTRRCVVG